MPAQFVSATPLVCAGPSLEEALRLYVGHLGFHVTWQAPGGAGVEREGVAFNLVQSNDRHWAENCSVSSGTELHVILPSGV